MELIPLITFTVLGGLAAGAVVISLFARTSLLLECGPRIETEAVTLENGANSSNTLRSALLDKRAIVFFFVCLAMLGFGLLATLAHLQQPLRFTNGLSNPSSMISQESYWSIAFMILLVACTAQAFVKKRVSFGLHALCAFAGLGVMTVTSLAYCFSTGVPLWNDALTIPFFFVGNLALGAAVCLLFCSSLSERRVVLNTVCLLLIIEAVVTTALWIHLNTSIESIHPYGFVSPYAILLGISLVLGIVAPMVLACLLLRNERTRQQRSPLPIAVALSILLITGIVIARSVFFVGGIHI